MKIFQDISDQYLELLPNYYISNIDCNINIETIYIIV